MRDNAEKKPLERKTRKFTVTDAQQPEISNLHAIMIQKTKELHIWMQLSIKKKKKLYT